MTYQEAVKHAAAKLQGISDNPALDAQLLICHACNIGQTQLIAHSENELSNEENTSFIDLLKRRCKGEPLAYITGEKEFWSLSFTVNKEVLIPRPETELLVETALNIASTYQAPSILDLGTGSGAIAVTIAKECSECIVYASDISSSALEVAKLNAIKYEVEIKFTQSDWYKSLSGKKYDLIVCNPPYVSCDDTNLDPYVLKHEPSHALISQNKGLHDLELIISQSKNFLNCSGYLLIEHGFNQGPIIQQFFQQHGFKDVQTHKDLSGHDRVTFGNI